MTSVRILNSKSVERIENITCSKVLKYILALNEESKINVVVVSLEYF